MQDDQQTQNMNSQTTDDFYSDAETIGVTEEKLKMMAAVTEAQIEAAENTDQLLQEMDAVVKEAQADNQ